MNLGTKKISSLELENGGLQKGYNLKKKKKDRKKLIGYLIYLNMYIKEYIDSSTRMYGSILVIQLKREI